MKLATTILLTVAAGGMLLASPAHAQDSRTVALRFRKLGDTSVVIKNAAVLVDHTMEATTDSLGIAHIVDLEDGGHIVEVVAKGYEAYFDNFVSGPKLQMINLDIKAAAEVPKPRGQATDLVAAGFDKRRAAGLGKFFTPAQIKAADGRPLANFLKVDAGAYIANGPNSESYLASRALSKPSAPCYAAVVRDGLRLYPFETATPPDLDKIFTDDLLSVELYSAAGSAGLGTAAKCGALILWSRHP